MSDRFLLGCLELEVEGRVGGLDPQIPIEDQEYARKRGEEGLGVGQLFGIPLLWLATLPSFSEDEHRARDCVIYIADGGRAAFDVLLRTVLGDQYCLVDQANYMALPYRSERGVFECLAGLFTYDAEDALEGLAVGFRLRPARERLREGIEERNAAVCVGGDDRVTCA